MSYNSEGKRHKKETPTFQKSLGCTPKDDFVHKPPGVGGRGSNFADFETTLFTDGPLLILLDREMNKRRNEK